METCHNHPHSKTQQNFNPVLLLPTYCLNYSLCKILERIVTLRLKYYLESNKILSPYLSGFRTGLSTLDSLSSLEYSIHTATLKGAGTIAVFLDISQAFDSVHHPSV